MTHMLCVLSRDQNKNNTAFACTINLAVLEAPFTVPDWFIFKR